MEYVQIQITKTMIPGIRKSYNRGLYGKAFKNC